MKIQLSLRKFTILLSAWLLMAVAAYPLRAETVRNGKIAFTSDHDGNRDIYTISPDGREIQRLTDDPGWDDYAAFSPDGRQIAYVSQVNEQYFIKTINASGGGQRVVTQINFDLSTPNLCGERFSLDWSPDGRKIIFQEFGDIMTVNVNGTGRSNLTNTALRETEPCWGNFGFAYAAPLSINKLPDMGLWIHLSSTVKIFGELSYYTCSVSPDISRDGRKLAYVSGSDLVPPGFIDIAETEAPFQQRRLELLHVMTVRWSPDGGHLVFGSITCLPGTCVSKIEVVDEFGNGRRVLTEGTNPSWGPGKVFQPSPTVFDETVLKSGNNTALE